MPVLVRGFYGNDCREVRFYRQQGSITKESPCILTKAQHDVRVMIDEEGCTAAAYTVLLIDETGMPLKEEVDFVLNRPFLFVITSEVGLPLFVGIVNHPV